MKRSRAMLLDFLLPLALLFILTSIIAVTRLDLLLEAYFYHPGEGWIHSEEYPWGFLYRYGVLPSMAIGLSSIILLVAGFFSARAYVYRKCAAFYLLLLLLGPGLLVNTCLKEHWGRPRPRQVTIFGGNCVFSEVWQPVERGKGNGMSFPSGHASVAFYLIAPYFVLRRSSPKRAALALTSGIGYGLLMGLARMVQGGHFPSDVLWAGGCVYLVGLALYYLLGMDREVLLQPKGGRGELKVEPET